MTEPETRNHTVRMVPAIAHGTVIDHLPPGVTLKVVELLASPSDEVLIGINFRSRSLGRKGVVKITGRELSAHELSRLALIAPDASVSIIRGYEVIGKGLVQVPSTIVNIARCPNPNCVTNHEPSTTHFSVETVKPLVVRCIYCEREFAGSELEI